MALCSLLLFVSFPPSRVLLTHRRSTKLRDALHAEVTALGATSLGEWGLYDCTAPALDGMQELLLRAAAARLLLAPLAACDSLATLLPKVRALSLRESCGWRLRLEDLSPPEDDAPRNAALCALAQLIEGEPALTAAEGDGAAVSSLILLRGSTVGYVLARVTAAQPEALRLDGQTAQAWRSRPFKFEAASDFALARVALSLCGAEPGRHTVFDPCSGSGTLLYAAATLGLEACGLDINERMVVGASSNLAHALPQVMPPGYTPSPSPSSSQPSARLPSGSVSAGGGSRSLARQPAVELHDARLPFGSKVLARRLPSEGEAAARVRVVCNLPWGRSLALPDGDEPGSYLRDLLRGVARRVSGSRGCFIVGGAPAPAAATLEDAGYQVLSTTPVGSRSPRAGETLGETRPPLCTLVVAIAPGTPV